MRFLGFPNGAVARIHLLYPDAKLLEATGSTPPAPPMVPTVFQLAVPLPAPRRLDGNHAGQQLGSLHIPIVSESHQMGNQVTASPPQGDLVTNADHS